MGPVQCTYIWVQFSVHTYGRSSVYVHVGAVQCTHSTFECSSAPCAAVGREDMRKQICDIVTNCSISWYCVVHQTIQYVLACVTLTSN